MSAAAAPCGLRDGQAGGRGRRARAALGAAAVAAVLLTAACGALPGLGRGGGGPVAFSACMRAHGVPDFPDPGRQGFQVNETSSSTTVNGVTLREDLAQVRSAQQACQSQKAPGQGNAPPASPQEQQAALAYAQCMRSHGLPDFPDPKVTASSFMVRMPPGIHPQSPQFQAAQQACRSLISQYGG